MINIQHKELEPILRLLVMASDPTAARERLEALREQFDLTEAKLGELREQGTHNTAAAQALTAREQAVNTGAAEAAEESRRLEQQRSQLDAEVAAAQQLSAELERRLKEVEQRERSVHSREQALEERTTRLATDEQDYAQRIDRLRNLAN